MNRSPIDILSSFYGHLLAGDADALRSVFGGQAQLDAPLQGAVRGAQAFSEFVNEQQNWLLERDARPRLLDQIITPVRVVFEFVVDLNQGRETIDLPVALAADRQGEGISAIRIYHSTWPLTGQHAVRAPLLPPAEGLEEPAVVRAYMEAIGSGNTPAVLALFAEDGYARQPSGERFKAVGPDLIEFYGPALEGGGVVLEHCTATCDDHACAIEFIAVEWARVKLPPQAGLAVYQFEGDKIKAARIYDDVQPPFLE